MKASRMTEVSKTVEIINKLGLHARAAATLVRVTAQFQCEIKLVKGNYTVDAKSILGMMTLAAGPGTTLVVHCSGDDAEEAATAVAGCISNRFGEDE